MSPKPSSSPAAAPLRRGGPSNPLVAVLVYDGLCAFEFGCAAEVFGLARPELQA